MTTDKVIPLEMTQAVNDDRVVAALEQTPSSFAARVLINVQALITTGRFVDLCRRKNVFESLTSLAHLSRALTFKEIVIASKGIFIDIFTQLIKEAHARTLTAHTFTLSEEQEIPHEVLQLESSLRAHLQNACITCVEKIVRFYFESNSGRPLPCSAISALLLGVEEAIDEAAQLTTIPEEEAPASSAALALKLFREQYAAQLNKHTTEGRLIERMKRA
jgi:hypothetical protein